MTPQYIIHRLVLVVCQTNAISDRTFPKLFQTKFLICSYVVLVPSSFFFLKLYVSVLAIQYHYCVVQKIIIVMDIAVFFLIILQVASNFELFILSIFVNVTLLRWVRHGETGTAAGKKYGRHRK